jgi:dolichol-phosphate mannosyltransferase
VKIVLVFPVYNESKSLRKYMQDLILGLKNFNCEFILIDDASTDSTLKILKQLKMDYPDIIVHKNIINLGHGPTVIKGLQLALNQKPSMVICSDSDGEVKVADFLEAIHIFQDSRLQLLEGVRKQRSSDSIRFTVSAVARVLVLIKSGSISKDANTPFRAYRPDVLETLLNSIPQSTLIPNIWISIHARKLGLNLCQIDLHPNDPIQSAYLGSSWAGKTKLTSRIKFVRFAFKSFFQAVRF